MANKYQFPNATSGVDDLLVGVQSSYNLFTPMILTFVFFTVLLGGILSQKRRLGYADLPMWTVLASMSTLMIALPMTLIQGLIDPLTLGVVVVVTLISGFWFFLSKDRGEI